MPTRTQNAPSDSSAVPTSMWELATYCTIGVSIFLVALIDLTTRLGLAVWLFYVLPVSLSLWLRRPHLPLLVALLCSLLLTLNYLDPSAGLSRNITDINRLIGISVLWCIGITGYFFVRNRNLLRQESALRNNQTVLSALMLGEQRVEELGQAILNFFTSRLQASCGAVYIQDRTGYRLVAHQGVAAEGAPETFTAADGLLGQAVRTRRTIVMHDLPEGYLTMASALGQGSPRHLVIVPALADNNCKGVVELGFLERFEDTEMELLDRLAEPIGNALQSAIYRERLQGLLEETQQQSEELQAQSEELRVSNEELEEQSRTLQESQSRLEQQQAELEQTNTQLEDQTHQLETQRDNLKKIQSSLELRTRELQQASQYKSDFLANMSHELRTPLNSILILSDQLKLNAAGNLTEKQVRHAEIIYRAGHDLLQLINDVLDLARIEAGHMQLKLEPLDLRELLAELESGLAPMAEQKGLALRVEVEPDVPVQLVSDRVRLLQILRNLLTNALKFTEQGKVEVRVSRRSAPQAGDVLQIQVCDTGIGIAEAEQERIFQAFEQIDGSISRQYGGTGLGLAIARQLVEVLGGGISVKSAPGKGACFTVELPIQLASTGATEQLAVTRRRGRGPGLLIVDSDADFASVVAECGQNHGFSSVVCETGQQGMLALEHERFAAVIMEILLPDISGWQLHRALRTDGRHQDVPVYIITSVPKPQDWHDGDSHYLLKPVSQAELERLFVDLAQRERNPMRLLLMETDPERRHRLHRYLEQLGYRVTDCRRSEEARLAFAERPFSALVIDFDLPNEDGLDLLEALGRLRPLQDVSIIVNSEDPLSEHNLQRLRRYSGVALSKHEGLEHMKEALKPATTQVGAIAMNDAQHPSLGQRVLLVDADVRSIYILSALLDEQGLQVVAATTSSEALERFDEDAFDLALIDTKLPNDDGPALIRQLRNDYGCQVPVVALCSVLEEAERERCIEAGANDYLVKPTDQASLARLLQRWLNRDGGSLQS